MNAPMPSAAPRLLTFQDALHRLERYWADVGCLVWMPHNVEVGAGTMNPATFLYVLGPEPWNVAYVEPGIRPDDARYGENPNRLGRHHQFQVILKPDPGDPQQLYLNSLAALGIDLAAHDVRFVEDNWESPALGAWGLGWEVWLDGLEITQFTYFQQAGAVDLAPNSIEITYGLDRILMALQDVTHFKRLKWNDFVTFEDVMLPGEQETSRYYFELADIDRLRQLFDLTDAEAQAALDAGLVRPAHDYVLKCSHLFNLLDARGAIGVTERQRFFGRMRRQAKAVAERYLAERERLGYPLLSRPESAGWVATSAGAASRNGATASDASATSPASGDASSATTKRDAGGQAVTTLAPFVFEIGCEELPVDDVTAMEAFLALRAPALLDGLRLAHGGCSVIATPRRLALIVADLAARQTDAVSEVVGPPAKAAFAPDGSPTKAAEGFAKSAGVGVADLVVIERGGESRVAATKHEAGLSAAEVLAPALAKLVDELPVARGMRWDGGGKSFSRPVRWLLALHGEQVVPVRWGLLSAGRESRGLRSAGSPIFSVASAAEYGSALAGQGIIGDRAERRAAVWQAVQEAGRSIAAGTRAMENDALLDEVTNLVEAPLPIVGRFDPEFLSLPAPVLITVMKKHQRYFPVVDGQGALQPCFITVANGTTVSPDVVRHGNEAVVAARFADAAYFWKQDGTKPLAEFGPALASLTFQGDLGSMLDKQRRLEALVPELSRMLGLSAADATTAARAASLAKCDLATSMVVEMTSLQGTMGAAYARLSGEPEAVAMALHEQYQPRGAGDGLPETAAGTVLALADRLDSLVGLFAAGVRPKGTNDPFGLRRAALGVTTILAEGGHDLDLGPAIDATARYLPASVTLTPEVRDELLEFIRRRLEGQLRDAGRRPDAVSAVLAVQGDNPARAAAAVAELEQATAGEGWMALLTAYARCARIVRGRDDVAESANDSTLADPAEKALWAAVQSVIRTTDRNDLRAVLAALATLTPAINGFFDAVLVMAEDAALRANRLALAGQVARLPAAVADLSFMEGF